MSGWNTALEGTGTGYSLGGTYPNIQADVTLYAQWTESGSGGGTTKPYTVTYYGNGGTSSGLNMLYETVEIGDIVTLDKKGFTNGTSTMTGWRDDSGNVWDINRSYTPTRDIKFYAIWSSDNSGESSESESTTKYKITFNGKGGTRNGSSTYSEEINAGKELSLDNRSFTRSGYGFAGWSETENGTILSGNYIPTSSKTLYAQWISDTTTYYTVKYNANGGTISGSNATTFEQSLEQGKSIKIAGKVFQRTGFDLDYWTTNVDGSGTRYNIDQTYSTNSRPSLTDEL